MRMIHPTAVVSPSARLGANVSIGPFCIIEDGADVGDDCRLAARVVVKSDTTLGSGNEIGEGAVLGGRPQHLHAGQQVGRLVIGDGNMIRENATLHRGLNPENTTLIGSHNLIMVNAHVAHDCRIGSHVVIVNNAMLAGFVTVADRAFLSGAAGVHQFCRIGRLAMVGGQSHIVQDVPPFVTVDGRSGLIVGLNVIGLRRAGFTSEAIEQLKAAYRVIYRSGLRWEETLSVLQDEFTEGPAAEFRGFLSATKRGITQERRMPRCAIVPLPPSGEVEVIEAPRVRRVG